MTCLNTHRIPASGRSGFATAEDFRGLFTEDPNALYMLSFLLTANHEKADRCFVAGLDDCVDGHAVFQEWAGMWARRVIVRNAIRIIAPRKGEPQQTEIADQPAGKRRVLEMRSGISRLQASSGSTTLNGSSMSFLLSRDLAIRSALFFWVSR